MPLTTDFRGIWTGTNAAIPTNWSRDTAFNDRFVSLGNPWDYTSPTNGGNSSHNHTCDDHTHVGDAHTHTIQSGNDTGAATTSSHTSGFPTGASVTQTPHSHAQVNSASATQEYDDTTVSLDASSDKPPYVDVIVIQPDDNNQEYPDDAIGFTDQSTAPTGYNITDGTGGTTDLDGRFLKGEATGSGNGGATGGALTHSHTQTGSGHTHGTGFGHSHAASNVGAASATLHSITTAPLKPVVYPSIHHTVTLSTGSPGTVADDDTSTSTGSSVPEHVEILGVQNVSGGASTPEGLILIYVGDPANLPSDWELYVNSIDRWVRITKTPGDINNEDGSNSHTHEIDHGHTHSSSHSHGAVAADTNSYTANRTATSTVINAAISPHTHTWTIGSTTCTMQDATVTMSTEDGRYLFRDVLLVRKRGDATVVIRGGSVKGGVVG